MIINDHEPLKKKLENYLSMSFVRRIDQKEIYATDQIIKQDVQDIVEKECWRRF